MSQRHSSPAGRWWPWWVVSTMLAGAGILVLVGSLGGVQRTSAAAGGTPVRVLMPEGTPTAPAIVLAHGFSGSAAMMDPLGSALVRAGHVVVMPDLPGHGSNAAPLADGVLEPAIGEAVEFAGQLTGQPVAVAGHSMGAGAVTAWAIDNRSAATVAISLPSAEDLPDDPARPRNLLLLWGAAEQPRFVEAALAGLAAGYPGGEPGVTYGEPGAGTARRAVEIAGAEHVAVIYRAQTAQEVAAWVGGGEPVGDARLVGLALVMVAAVVAARPLLGRGAGVPAGAVQPAPGASRTLGWMVLGVVGAGLGARVLQPLGEAVPVAVAGYLAAWFGSGAVVLSVGVARRRASRGSWPGLVRGALAGMLVTAGLALPARVTWAAFAPVGPRWWVLAGLLVVLGAWLWGEAALLAGTTGWRRAGLLTASRVLVVVGLLGAVVLLGAPGFLTLTVPLVVPLLAILAVLAWWARDPAAAAAAQAVPLALAIATTFPLVA